MVQDCSGGQGMFVNGKRTVQQRLGSGDSVTAGTFSFQLVNQALPTALIGGGVPLRLRFFAKLPAAARAGIASGAVAIVLYVLLASTGNPVLVPVTLIAMSSVIPATVICHLVTKHDRTGITFRTLAVTFLLGGTLGIIFTVLLGMIGGLLTLGLLNLAVFAGVLEEPAKLLGTMWRWRHPAYDRPMDGLILGTVSGLGFAVFETAGYGFTVLIQGGGTGGVLFIMVLRGLLSPFGHGLWSGIVAAAFWQCGRDVSRAFHSRIFFKALFIAIGLHALWNLGLFWIGLIASGTISARYYRKLLARKGYAT